MSLPKNAHMECGEWFIQGERKQPTSSIPAVFKVSGRTENIKTADGVGTSIKRLPL